MEKTASPSPSPSPSLSLVLPSAWLISLFRHFRRIKEDGDGSETKRV